MRSARCQPSLLNRDEMMDRVVRQVRKWMGAPMIDQERINCHPSHHMAVTPLRDAAEPALWAYFTQKEENVGKGLWLSRMGAISARVVELGLIPGSMGTLSYVVEGLGDPVALHSSPHSAGREYSRSAARKTFTASDLRAAMKGIEHRDTDAFIDEIPAAYKPIDQVMADAASLVTVRHTLRHIENVKGDGG